MDDQKSESDACALTHVRLWGALRILGTMFMVSLREAADNACCDNISKWLRLTAMLELSIWTAG